MRATLAPRDRRAVMIGAVILVPSLLYVYAVRPVARALSERRAATAQQADVLARERALLDLAPRLPALSAESARQLDVELKRSIQGEAAVTANVKLADYVRQIARVHELLVTEATEAPGDSLTSGVLLLRLSVRGESDFQGSLGFLRGIESGAVRARVASLQIEKSSGRPTAIGQTEDPRERLSLTATIEAPAVITARKGLEQ